MKNSGFIADCVEWDIVNWSKALTFWERKFNLQDKGFECLELGSRSGGLSLWMAEKGNNVICSDLENPEAQARKLHQRYSMRGRIEYEALDATNIPYENRFDLIMFKSILGGVSRDGKSHLNKVVIDQIYKALKVGGKLLFAENLEASKFHRFLRRKLVRWGSSWNYLKIADVSELFEKFTDVDYEATGFLGSFGINESQRKILGRLDTVLFDRIVTDDMKYILFGVATK
ncbi:MAG: class I SAM-dependent methyltransferase [Cyclobacteriaceae bacterium]